MKIQFIEEKIIDGDGQYERWSTEIDGSYVNNSLSRDKEKAKRIYDQLVRSRGGKVEITILESIEI